MHVSFMHEEAKILLKSGNFAAVHGVFITPLLAGENNMTVGCYINNSTGGFGLKKI